MLALLPLLPALAGQPDAPAVALGGFDTVAYFSLPAGAPAVKGVPKYWTNIALPDASGLGGGPFEYTLLFSTAANRDAFVASPYQYLPQWGGFCAYGMTHEFSDQGWPWARDYLGPPGGLQDAWFVFKGKLYATFFANMTAPWVADGDANVATGDKRWQAWFGASTSNTTTTTGPLNVNCTSDAWWGNTCTYSPQRNAGVPTAKRPISDECVATLDGVCSDHKEGLHYPPPCQACLESNMPAIVDAGTCPIVTGPSGGTRTLSRESVLVYCM